MILSPKWQQTYEEALQAMKDTTYSQYSLADVSTHHHTGLLYTSPSPRD